jgi:hypothetical protein
MRQTLLLVCLCLALMSPAFGQTVTELREQYGQPIEAYSVSEHIWMTPEFAEGGQVCSMRLYPKRISATTNYLGQDKLNYWELKKVLEQLAPTETRGNETKSSGLTMLLGQVSETVRSYDNLAITFLASIHFDGPLARLPESSRVNTGESSVPKKSLDDLDVPRDAEIAAISWFGRGCPERNP